jgi:hypothetical protein
VSASSDKVYCDEPYVSIRWDSAGGWVIAEWKSWANSIEFRAACEQALLAVKDNHASRWLMDGRELRVIVEADQRWLAEDWGPRLVRAGVRHSALVLPRSGLASLTVENVGEAHHLDAEQRQAFATLEEAKKWLSRS